MQIKFSKKFSKHYDKVPAKIRKAVQERLKLFKENKFAPVLNNHSLTGKYIGYRSINITGDWRALFREIEDETIAFFELLDTLSNLYG